MIDAATMRLLIYYAFLHYLLPAYAYVDLMLPPIYAALRHAAATR